MCTAHQMPEVSAEAEHAPYISLASSNCRLQQAHALHMTSLSHNGSLSKYLFSYSRRLQCHTQTWSSHTLNAVVHCSRRSANVIIGCLHQPAVECHCIHSSCCTHDYIQCNKFVCACLQDERMVESPSQRSLNPSWMSRDGVR